MNSYNKQKNTYVRTQMLNTLLDMLKEQSLDSIVISKLIEKAGVSRVSFYRNYQTLEDILKQECSRLIREWQKEYDSTEHQSDDDFGKSLMDYMKQHSAFFLTLYRSRQFHILEYTIMERMEITEDLPNGIAYLKSYIAYGIYGWIKEWTKRGMQESGTEFSKMVKAAQSQ